MRWILISIFILIIGACKKESQNLTPQNLPSYIGTWELRSSRGGLTGEVKYASGQGNYLEITGDSVILTYQHNRVDGSTYRVEQDTTYFFGEPRLMDKLIARDNWSFFFIAMNNTLTTYVGAPASDGGSAVYVKVLQTD
jgi:hypothetical protein